MHTGASLNVRSLKHFGEQETLIHGLEKLPAIFYLSETWLNSGDGANSLLVTDWGYHQHALTNRISKGGGHMIQLKLIDLKGIHYPFN